MPIFFIKRLYVFYADHLITSLMIPIVYSDKTSLKLIPIIILLGREQNTSNQSQKSLIFRPKYHSKTDRPGI